MHFYTVVMIIISKTGPNFDVEFSSYLCNRISQLLTNLEAYMLVVVSFAKENVLLLHSACFSPTHGQMYDVIYKNQPV